jgi:O-acetyl-ADP-ribose deacetylase (regulator of RNase III)
MSDEKRINGKVIRLMRGDITEQDIDCFVFYAQSNLKLGSGFGGAITVRGGPTIQKELDAQAPIESCQAVLSEAGHLKAKYIIHANGPKFQEPNTEAKLRTTVLNALKTAEDKGLKRIAFPPMGTGFYGVPLGVSARVMFDTFSDFVINGGRLEEVVVCVQDSREYSAFSEQLQQLAEEGD